MSVLKDHSDRNTVLPPTPTSPHSWAIIAQGLPFHKAPQPQGTWDWLQQPSENHVWPSSLLTCLWAGTGRDSPAQGPALNEWMINAQRTFLYVVCNMMEIFITLHFVFYFRIPNIAQKIGQISLYNAFPWFWSFFFFSSFLWPNQWRWHKEVTRLGVKLELQLPAYTIASAMPDPSHIDNHSLWQGWILNPLSEARDWTCILQRHYVRFLTHWATAGALILVFIQLMRAI